MSESLGTLLDASQVRQSCEPSQDVTALLVDFTDTPREAFEGIIPEHYPIPLGGIFFIEEAAMGAEFYNDPIRLWNDWEHLLEC